MTPEEAATAICHTTSPPGHSRTRVDVLRILSSVAATTRYDTLIEVAEKWEKKADDFRRLTCTGHVQAGRHAWGACELRILAEDHAPGEEAKP